MAKVKLSLEEMKVQSFVTTLSDEQQLAVRGGITLRETCSTGNCGTDLDCYVDTVSMCTSLIYCSTDFACSTGITNCGGSTSSFPYCAV